MKTITNIPVKTKSGAVATTAQVKKQLQIEADFTDDDTYIGELIEVATETVENDINADVRTTVNVLTQDVEFDSKYHVMCAPLQSFTKFEYYDGTDWTEVDASNYEVETFFHSFSIYFETLSFTCEKIRLTFTTGYTDETYPAQLRHAVLLRCSDLYDSERQGMRPAHIVENSAYSHLIAKHTRKYW